MKLDKLECFHCQRHSMKGNFLGNIDAYAQKIYIQTSVNIFCPAYNSASLSVWTQVCLFLSWLWLSKLLWSYTKIPNLSDLWEIFVIIFLLWQIRVTALASNSENLCWRSNCCSEGGFQGAPAKRKRQFT